MIPQKDIDHYNLYDKVTIVCWLYCEIRKAIYGLKEASKLANIELQLVLQQADTPPCTFTQGPYQHSTHDITLSLVVDDFGVKNNNKEDVDHLLACLRTSYPITTD